MLTFLMLGQAEIHVPSGHEDHVVSEILALYLELLHDDNVCLENIEHGLNGRVSQLLQQVLTDRAHSPRNSVSPAMAGTQTDCECR